jgi:hypothetical protein
MALPELDTSHITPLSDSSPIGAALVDATLGWNASRPILSNISLTFPKVKTK